MSDKILELKAKIYDELLKKTVAERNIAILEQQLQQEQAAHKPSAEAEQAPAV